MSLSDNNQTDVIETFTSTARYLNDLLNIHNPYIEQMVGQAYSTNHWLIKTNSYATEAPILYLDLSIMNDILSYKIYDEQDHLKFKIINFQLPLFPYLWCIYLTALSF